MKNIQLCKNYNEMSRQVADIIEDRISKQDRFNIALPTGNTPIKMYEYLASKQITWNKVNTFNLDEYVGVPDNHPALFRNFMLEHLHSKVAINADQIFFPTDNYDEIIAVQGGLDLTILGLGVNAHIAYNEPGSEFDSLSRTVVLEEDTRNRIIKNFGSEWHTPRYAKTMGIKTILDSKEIVLMVQGLEKLDVLERSLWMDPTTSRPASALQLHSNITIFYSN
jgi:glucosamine-6-phosphate deaminase